jgi:DNA-directed RNA polymerase specialized sigma subunit
MATRKDEIPPHRILREVYRHYLQFQELVTQDGRNHVIEHGYWVYDPKTKKKRKVHLAISFWDLQDALKPQSEGGPLSDRKREAFLHNVIYDKKQKDVAEIMGITTVSVGQYVEAACEQLAENYFDKETLDLYRKNKAK